MSDPVERQDVIDFLCDWICAPGVRCANPGYKCKCIKGIVAIKPAKPCDDAISRQAAINLAKDVYVPTEDGVVYKHRCIDPDAVRELPSVSPERTKECDACEDLEEGDTLYRSSDWDGGIGYDYIRDIRFCPKCGRRLPK